MIKKEKDKLDNLRKNFYKFHTNGMLVTLKKNSKLTKTNCNSTKNDLDNLNLEDMKDEKDDEKKK
jgi:hypothetical protein